MRQYIIIGVCIVTGLLAGAYSEASVKMNVPLPIEDMTLYEDVAIIAMKNGQYDVAIRYFKKTGNLEKIDKCLKKKSLSDEVLEKITQCLEMPHTHLSQKSAFSRLVSIETIQELPEDDPVMLPLLLAKWSAMNDFALWQNIANHLEILSQLIEGSQPDLSVLLYEISQYEVIYD
jgi:tetratricopeptide (TPR) repeat protein